MFRVCLHGYSDPQTLDQWGFVLSHWKPDMVYILGGPDSLNTNSKPLKDAKRIATAEALPKTPKLVLLSPKAARYVSGTQSLIDFKHPADAIYLFGSNKKHLDEDDLGSREPDSLVYIPTFDHHEMFDFVAGAATFYDRMVKRG